MAQIDIGKTAFAGFDLVRRKPLTVVGWGLFLFVVGVLPALAFIGPMIGNFAAFVEMAKANPDPDPEQLMAMMAPMYAAHPILWLTSLIYRVMLTGAIFRAILQPSAGSWAYLRVSMAEVMLALVVVVLGILVGLGAAVWIGVSVGVSIALWQASHPIAVGVGILLCVGFFVSLIWVLLRFSLAAPMSFAEKDFRLFESWRVTRGNAFRLLLVALIVWFIMMALEMVVFAVVMAVGLAVTGLSGPEAISHASIEAFFSRPVATWMPQVLPWAVGLGLIGSIVGAVFLTVATAPWAEAYRQLRKTPDAVV